VTRITLAAENFAFSTRGKKV